MPYTQTQLDALQAALAAGIRRVTFDSGKTIEYNSLADLERAIQVVSAGVAGVASTRQVRMYCSKGVDNLTGLDTGFPVG